MRTRCEFKSGQECEINWFFHCLSLPHPGHLCTCNSSFRSFRYHSRHHHMSPFKRHSRCIFLTLGYALVIDDVIVPPYGHCCSWRRFTTNRRACASAINVCRCRPRSGTPVAPNISSIGALTTAPAWLHHRSHVKTASLNRKIYRL